jgi:hypothetical protein
MKARQTLYRFVPVLAVVGLVSAAVAAQAPAPAAQAPPAAPAAAPPTAPPADSILTEPRQAYDSTNYERARELLDSVIAGLGSAPATPEQRQVLIQAYELRARTRFNLRELESARVDLRAILLLDPGHVLSTLVAPGVVTLFAEVKKTTVGEVAIEVTPPDSLTMLDQQRIASEVASMSLVGGTHTISASRTGFAPSTQTFTVVPGMPLQRVVLALERVSSNLALVTSPANIEVIIDGVSRGVTELDPEGKGENGALVSKRFVIADLQNGRHTIEFRRDCFVTEQRPFDVPKPSDYRLDTVSLKPAVATVTVAADAAGATVFVDDTPKGAAPMVLDDICEGSHVLEVRTPFGRHVRRMDLKPGQKETFQARVRPAFAIISDSGAAGNVRGGPDLRLVAEQAFQDSSSVTLFAPPEKRAAELMAADQLPIDWLAFDELHRPIGKAETIGEPARAEIGGRMIKTLGAQGLAAVARDPGGTPADMLLILMAPGSVEPDVIRWRRDDPQSIREAVRRLDQAPQLYKSSIGVLAIDVHEVEGAVVATVNNGSSGAVAGIRPGDTIVSAGGAPVRGVVELSTAVDAKQTGQPLALELKDAAGAAKKVEVVVQAIPNVVSLADRALLSNKLSVEYTYRAAALTDALDEVAVRLNLAALSLRLRNRVDATRDLEQVLKVLSEGRITQPLLDAATGTAHYLLGLAAEASGDNAGATRAWRQAAQSTANLLTDGGEPIKDLAEQRLNQLQATRTGPRP